MDLNERVLGHLIPRPTSENSNRWLLIDPIGGGRDILVWVDGGRAHMQPLVPDDQSEWRTRVEREFAALMTLSRCI